jgi:hypothetical protein
VFNLTMWNLIGKLKKNVGRCPEEIWTPPTYRNHVLSTYYSLKAEDEGKIQFPPDRVNFPPSYLPDYTQNAWRQRNMLYEEAMGPRGGISAVQRALYPNELQSPGVEWVRFQQRGPIVAPG